ncbi:MAG: hypothetical protein AABZ47_06790 [Planctomycetota bacterium]
MNTKPLKKTDMQSIAQLQTQLDELRRRLNIDDRGAILFRVDLSYGDDEVALVEADGYGGATLRVVEGHYPVDFFTHEERVFPTEAAAVIAAEALRMSITA